MEGAFDIKSFSGGLNEYVAEGLLEPSECVKIKNCNIENGSLKSIVNPSIIKTFGGTIHSLMPFYNNTKEDYVVGIGAELKNSVNSLLYAISGNKLDSLNFEYKGNKVFIGTSDNDVPFMVTNGVTRKLKNRRISYNDKGVVDGYIDANGTKKSTENDVTTYAPKGNFIELHYDRLWVAGNSSTPDRVYFSTAGVNGADIEDWTAPIEEAEANQHGGFIDVRSYDGGKIIGLKVIFNNIVIFKNKSAYKIFGDNPGNYELVQLFSSSGAIADKSICVGNNGAYFLNDDGIYFYDGTNTNLISQKISKTIKGLNNSYAKLSVGCFYNNKYYLALPINGTTNNTLIIYDTISNSFVINNVGDIRDFVEIDSKLYYSNGSSVMSLNEGTTYLPLYSNNII